MAANRADVSLTLAFQAEQGGGLQGLASTRIAAFAGAHLLHKIAGQAFHGERRKGRGLAP